jgi:hypothetical protein
MGCISIVEFELGATAGAYGELGRSDFELVKTAHRARIHNLLYRHVRRKYCSGVSPELGKGRFIVNVIMIPADEITPYAPEI